MNLFLVTILPSIVILYFFFTSDKYKEPIPSLIKCFLVGVFLTLPSYILTTSIIKFFVQNTDIDVLYIFSFLGGALVEELLKFIGIFACLHLIKDFDEPIDGIIYGVCISIGFATLENFYYIYYLEYKDTASLILRSLGAIPLHALTGAVIGMYMVSFFYKSKQKFYTGFFITYLVHSFYNLLILNNLEYLALLLITVSCYVFLNKFAIIKKQQ